GDGGVGVEMLHGEVTGSLIDEHGAQIGGGGTEGRVVATLIAHEGQPACDEGMIDDGDVHAHHVRACVGVANSSKSAPGGPWDNVVTLSHLMGNAGVCPPVGTSQVFAQSYRA